jgi:hypothetical protein
MLLAMLSQGFIAAINRKLGRQVSQPWSQEMVSCLSFQCEIDTISLA